MSKLPIFEWFLSRGDVLISVNTRVDAVDVPPHLKRQEIVDFILGAVPTPKLSTGPEGIDASMRFAGKVYSCHFPWDSILQMSGHDAVIQFRNPLMEETPPENKNREKQGQKKTRPNLRVIK